VAVEGDGRNVHRGAGGFDGAVFIKQPEKFRFVELFEQCTDFLGRDLRHGPRTLEGLGLAGLGRDALLQQLHQGA
jgi:hypothetical protein